MLALSLFGGAAPLRRVLAIGCHADDIEIGCGGTLLALTRSRPDVEVTWVVLGAEGERAAEARTSAEDFLTRASRSEVVVHGFKDAYMPYYGEAVKEAFEQLKRVQPDLVLTHTRNDLHQDHRLACELTWNTFRDHLILEYEVPKWDGDLGRPNLYVPLDEDVVTDKLELVLRHFPTQAGKHWYDDETFRGLMRLRGLECASVSRYAEAFYAPKVTSAPDPMRILVTGSHGYIGSVLAPIVAGAGHDVVGLDTSFYRGCDFGDDLATIATVHRDVRDVTPADFEGFDAVVHLAALSNDPIGDLNEQWTYDINLDATLRVAREAKAAGVGRFVFASSCSMYGASGTDDLLDEGAPLQPLTAYAESKVRAEEGLAALGGDGFAIVSMRNATVYGVSPRLRLDIVLNNLAGWAPHDRPGPAPVGRALVAAARPRARPVPHGARDARGAGRARRRRGVQRRLGRQNYLVRDLAEVLADVTGCDVEFASDASPDPRSYRVDFSKVARAFPSFVFEWDARRGSEELVNAYRALPLTTELFEGRRYVRLRQLRHLLDDGELDDGLRWRDDLGA